MKRMHDKKQLAGGVTEEQFEELVRETPTDARAVIDQGKVQLQLEHDGNVLGIDDQFGETMCAGWPTSIKYPTYVYIAFESVDFNEESNYLTGDIIISGYGLAGSKIGNNGSSIEGIKSFLGNTIIYDLDVAIRDDMGEIIFTGKCDVTGTGTNIVILAQEWFNERYINIPLNRLTDFVVNTAYIFQWNNPFYIEI